jgi:hypothetical protein
MVVVVHQAISQGTGVKPVKRLANRRKISLSIRIIIEYRLAPITPRGDVVNRTGEFYA